MSFSTVPLLIVSPVVLLLDPLPILQDRMSGSGEALQKLGVSTHIEPTLPSQNQDSAVDGDHPAQESLKPLPEAQIRSPTSIKPREQSRNRSSNLQARLAAKLRSWIPLFDQSKIVGEDADQSRDPETGQG